MLQAQGKVQSWRRAGTEVSLSKVREQSRASEQSKPEKAEGQQASAQPESKSNTSNFGTSLMAFTLVLFCLFCAWYFGQFENNIVELLVNAIFYALAAVLAIISLALLINALIQPPSVRRLLLMLMGSGEDREAVGTSSLLAASPCLSLSYCICS